MSSTWWRACTEPLIKPFKGLKIVRPSPLRSSLSALSLRNRTSRDEKAGLRRDAIRSQVIDALEAQEIKETGNEAVGETRQLHQLRSMSPAQSSVTYNRLLHNVCVQHAFLLQIMRDRILGQKWGLHANFCAHPFTLPMGRVRWVIALISTAELGTKRGVLDLIELL
jgi:hypothetical protein